MNIQRQLFYRRYLALLFSLLFISSNAFATDSKASDIVGSGSLEFIVLGETTTRKPALLTASEATIKISGMVALVEISQHFTNDSPNWVEGRYVFPLPENAAVTALEMHIGSRRIVGEIKEKQAAKKIYNQAKKAGKKAALLNQHRPNLFSQKVANIAPHEKISVKLRYLQTVAYEKGVFSLRFPMTVTPRYIAGNPAPTTEPINLHGWGLSPPTQQVNDAHLITPPIIAANTHQDALINPITLQIELDAGLPLAAINSAYHEIVVNKRGNQHTIALASGKVSMDRDFVLSWQPTLSSTPTAAIFNETIDGDDYSLLMLMPPQKSSKQHIPKEVIFIIDTSGSMDGTSIRQAKAGLQFALKKLQKSDRFNIIEFNSNTHQLYKQPVAATNSNLQEALNFVSHLHSGGGTEMLPALNAAFSQDNKETHLKQIIFITDGSIGNEEELFKKIHQGLGNSRLFTIGIGSAPNSFFMRKAAKLGRGSFTYIGNINEVNDKMITLFNQITKPTLRDITIVDSSPASGDLNTSGKQTLEIFPILLPDLYDGHPVIATIRKDYELTQLTVKGNYQNQVWEQSLSLNNGKHHPGVAKLWARNKISSLLDQQREQTGRSTQQEETLLKQQILDVALTHQLMSPYTSFIAVEDKVSKPPTQRSQSVAAPNLLPQGQSLQSVSYPQTATPLWLHLLLGSLAMAIALLIKRNNKHAL